MTPTLIYHPQAALFRDLVAEALPGVSPAIACNEDDLALTLPDAEILLCGELPVRAIPMMGKLRWVQIVSAGVDRVLPVREALQGAVVTNARGIHAPLMADHVLAAMVMLHWDFPGLLRNQAAHLWERAPKPALNGRTLVVIGPGAIGAEIGRRAHHFGMRVLGVRRTAGGELPGFDRLYGPQDLLKVLPQAHVVCLSLPATSETRRMIGAAEFAAMKPGAFFVNIARGSIVDEAALIAALRDGSLAGAALDVYEQEPPADDNPLWDMPNVIMTPHISGLLDDNERMIVDIFAENFRRFHAGTPMHNVVDLNREY